MESPFFVKAREAIARVGLSLFLYLSLQINHLLSMQTSLFSSACSLPSATVDRTNKNISFSFSLYTVAYVRVMLTRRSQALHGSSSRGLSPYSFITISTVYLGQLQFKLERNALFLGHLRGNSL